MHRVLDNSTVNCKVYGKSVSLTGNIVDDKSVIAWGCENEEDGSRTTRLEPWETEMKFPAVASTRLRHREPMMSRL